MRNLRFFVTYVLILVIALIVGWASLSKSVATNNDLMREGNSKIAELKVMEPALAARADWDFSAHTVEERRLLKEDVAHYLSVLNRVLEIGSKRHMYFEDREEILSARDRAELQQKAIEQFERESNKRMVSNGSHRKVF